MSLNLDAIFQQMAAMPEVEAAVKKKAERLQEMLETRWPEVNELSKTHQKFLDGEPERAVQVTRATKSTNRPVFIVTVRNPDAVAHQAETGFVTKAVKDVS